MSEALIIKIIVVGIFTFLNGKKGFKDEDTELLNLPPPAASRSSNASLTICFLISAINCVMELEILKQLTREGERKGRRPKQIRNFGALVLLTEWLLVNRSCLFPTTPDSDSIPEETIQVRRGKKQIQRRRYLYTNTTLSSSEQLERSARKTFWTHIAAIANILNNPSTCPSWIADDVKLAEKVKKKAYIPKDIKEVAVFTPFESIPRVMAAKKLIESGNYSTKSIPPSNADELSNGERVIIFKKFVLASTQGDACPLFINDLGDYNLIDWASARSEEANDMELEGEDPGNDFGMNDDDVMDEDNMAANNLMKPSEVLNPPPISALTETKPPPSPALSASSNEEKIVYQKPLPLPPSTLPNAPLSSLFEMTNSAPIDKITSAPKYTESLPPAPQNLHLPFAFPQTSNPFWSEQAYTASLLKPSTSATLSVEMEDAGVIRSIEDILASDDMTIPPTLNPFFMRQN